MNVQAQIAYLELSRPETPEAMRAYLASHFRYRTGNGWSRTSYAWNIKVHRLAWPDRETESTALDIAYSGTDWPAYEAALRIVEEFERRHQGYYKIFTLGASGGYAVLHEVTRHFRGAESYFTYHGLDEDDDWDWMEEERLQERAEIVYDFDLTIWRALEAFQEAVIDCHGREDESEDDGWRDAA